eukprot:scaffold218637_cov51-Attheya_sp.AAC.2
MSSSSSTTENMTYNQIVAKFQQVASTIKHDQKELCRLNNAMGDLLHRYRRKDSVEIVIRTIAKSHDANIVGSTRMNINATRGCRKMSFRESQQKRGREKKRSLGNGAGIVASVVGQHNDDQYMNAVTKVLKKPCKLCQEPGHRGYARCPKVMTSTHNHMGHLPFPKIASSRGELCQKLGKDIGFVSSYLDVNDERVILKSMPQNMKALIVHKRLIRKGLEDKGLGSRSIIMQITFLAEGGDPHEQYDGVLFKLNVITK